MNAKGEKVMEDVQPVIVVAVNRQYRDRWEHSVALTECEVVCAVDQQPGDVPITRAYHDTPLPVGTRCELYTDEDCRPLLRTSALQTLREAVTVLLAACEDVPYWVIFQVPDCDWDGEAWENEWRNHPAVVRAIQLLNADRQHEESKDDTTPC